MLHTTLIFNPSKNDWLIIDLYIFNVQMNNGIRINVFQLNVEQTNILILIKYLRIIFGEKY